MGKIRQSTFLTSDTFSHGPMAVCRFKHLIDLERLDHGERKRLQKTRLNLFPPHARAFRQNSPVILSYVIPQFITKEKA